MIGGTACAAAIGLFYGYAFMTDFEQNDFCRILDKAEFSRLEAAWATDVMQKPGDGILVRLKIETDLPQDGKQLLSISLGSLADPNGIEYKGPRHDEVELRVALAPDEDSFPVFPSVQLLTPARRAVCVWEAEQGFDVERGDEVVRKRLILHTQRKAGVMGSIEILDDT